MRPWILSEHAASMCKKSTDPEWKKGGSNIVYKQSKIAKYVSR
jgi:hypothetical protein